MNLDYESAEYQKLNLVEQETAHQMLRDANSKANKTTTNNEPATNQQQQNNS